MCVQLHHDFHIIVHVISGAEWGTRTPDPRITNALLYQLSQFGNVNDEMLVHLLKAMQR